MASVQAGDGGVALSDKVADDIAELTAAQIREGMDDLVALLQAAIDDNASVGFVAPVAAGELEAFWHEVALDVDDDLRRLLVARRHGRIVGTVILAPSMKSNQAHRAEVQKLLVDPAVRGRGLGTRMMQRVEALAIGIGRWLVTLDTRDASAAERLYRRCGYTAAGSIPDYATDADGQYASCTFFYKSLPRVAR